MRFMAGPVDSVAFQNDRITPGLSVDCDGRELRLPMSGPMNTASYQCRLLLSRCTTFDENNDVSDRCEIEFPFMGPVTSLIVAGK